MKFSEVMKYYDYKMINIVRALKIARDTVNTWRKKDKIPFKFQCVLEIITDGKLRADREDSL